MQSSISAKIWKTACFSATVVALGIAEVSTARPAELAGTWLNPKANVRVRIDPCGGALCGTVVWLKYPTDPQTGETLRDENNPNPANRSRPLLGIEMMFGIKPDRTSGEWIGQIYLPGRGRVYDATFSLESQNGLKIEGCAMGGLLCHAETWTRVF